MPPWVLEGRKLLQYHLWTESQVSNFSGGFFVRLFYKQKHLTGSILGLTARKSGYSFYFTLQLIKKRKEKSIHNKKYAKKEDLENHTFSWWKQGFLFLSLNHLRCLQTIHLTFSFVTGRCTLTLLYMRTGFDLDPSVATSYNYLNL